MFAWGIFVGVAGTLVLEVIVLIVAWELSPESKEHREIKRRMRENSIKAGDQLYEEEYQRQQDKLREEINLKNWTAMHPKGPGNES